MRVTIRGETDGPLLSRDCFIEIGNTANALKSTEKRASECIEMFRLVRVTIWGETDSLLLGGDCFIEISNVAETLKPTL